MKTSILYIITVVGVSLFSGACQSKRSTLATQLHQSAEPAPVPTWVKAPGEKKVTQDARELSVMTKFIELSYEEDASDVPKKRYEKRMTEQELQSYLKSITQRKGTDLMSAPTVVMREGQTGRIEIGRPFRYPEDPLTPSEMKEELLGVSSSFRVQSRSEGKALKLDVFTEVKELKGFRQVEPGFEKPLIENRRVSSSVVMDDGEVIVFGGIITEDLLEIEDKVPLLGDLPILGRVFRNQHSTLLTKELIVVIHPKVIEKTELVRN